MARAAAGPPRVRPAAVQSTYERIYAVVRRIPRGRVATYGQVARLAGLANGARQVGYALHALRDGTTVPWHRVLNARGASSLGGGGAETQQILLSREGVAFDAGGRVSLARHQWRPGERVKRKSRRGRRPTAKGTR